MIDLKELEKDEYYKRYSQCLINRSFDPQKLEELLGLNKERKRLISEAESFKAQQNKMSEVIAKLKKEKADASKQISEMQELSSKVKDLFSKAAEADKRVTEVHATLPNLCHESTPVGKAEDGNKEVRRWGEIRKFSFKPKEHGELGTLRGLLDLERAAKVAGARFWFLLGDLALMERALINFMLDIHTTKHGYKEIMAPYMVNTNSMFGVGQFPKFFEESFHVQGTDYHLIPTSEASVTNYYAQEILDEEILPQKFVSFSPCFRAEAGAYGKDTKGILRVHQFHKVELLKFTHPSKSCEEHEALTRDAEEILKALELPYRTMALCTGDIGFSAAKCYDLEAWLPGQNAYREISSCSVFDDFQARRANIRFRSKGGKPQFVHTINGSGLAIGRTLIAIIENYQQEDGSIEIPTALLPYMHGKKSI